MITNPKLMMIIYLFFKLAYLKILWPNYRTDTILRTHDDKHFLL